MSPATKLAATLAVVTFGSLAPPVQGQSETPTISVAATSTPIEEGETASFTFSRTEPHDGSLTVDFNLDASTRTVASSLLGDKTVTFAADEGTATYTVATLDNRSFEEEPGNTPSQHVSVLISDSSDSSYEVGDDGNATVKVTDNDEKVELSLVAPEDGWNLSESAGEIELSVKATTLTAGSPTDNSYSIYVSTSTLNRTALSGTDFEPLSDLVRFSGTWSSITVEGKTRYTTTSTYKLEIVSDYVDENNETFDVKLQHTPGVTSVSFGTGTATVTIVDDDTRGVTLTPSALTVTEGDSTGDTYEVVLTSWPTDIVTLTLKVPSDSDLSVDQTELYFFEDEWDVAQTVRVTAGHDTGAPIDESWKITHAADGGDYSSLTVDAVDVKIEDDDVVASVSAAAAAEEGENATFTVSLARGSKSTAAVQASYTVGGTATSGDDYTAPSGSLTIPAGSDTGTITIATKTDDVLERAETLIVTLSGVTTTGGSGEISGTSGTATATITDPGQVAASVAAVSGREGEALAFPVTLTGKVSSDVVLAWSTSAGTATSGDDFTAVTAGSLTIAAGATSASVSVSTADDALAEGDETFTVTITGSTLPSGVTVGVSEATGTILDNEELVAAVTAVAETVSEGSTARFTVSLTGGTSTSDVVVTYAVEGSASAGGDYKAPSGSLTIPAGGSSGTIFVATFADPVLEPPEEIVIRITDGSTLKGNVVASSGEAKTIILDGDGPSVVADSAASVRIDGTPMVGAALTAVPVNVSDASDVREFRFRWMADDRQIPDETGERCVLTKNELGSMIRVELTYTDGSGAENRLVSDAVGPVGEARRPPPTQPETLPTLTISAGSGPVVEGSTVEFTVLRSHAETDLGAIGLTIGETGSMLAANPSNEILFDRGAAATVLRLETVDDGTHEAGSEVRATLSAGDLYELGAPHTAVVLVQDNDALPGLAVEGASAPEGAGTMEFVARLTTAAAEALSVDWSTSDGTATAGVDYVQASGTMRFAAGAIEERFSVELLDDGIADGNEYFYIALRSTWAETVESEVVGTILDDDRASSKIQLTLDRERVSEGEGPVAVTVTAVLDRSARAADTAVQLVLSGSGAPGAVDYSAAASFRLTIPKAKRRSAVTFTLRPENDRVDELDEMIEVSGTSALPVVAASLVLEDDDEPSRLIVLTASPRILVEDAGPTTVTVTGSLDQSARVVATQVRLTVVASGTPDVVRFEPVESFALAIPAEQTVGTATFVLRPADDTREANPETVEVRGEAVLPVSAASVVLLDDDDASAARAWLGRFARTIASQTVEAVEARLDGGGNGANHVMLAGYEVLGGRPGNGSPASSFGRYREDQLRDLLARSSFSVSSSSEGGDGATAGNWTAWGRGAVTDFRGVEGDLSLSGEVVMGTVGFDYERGRWLTGLAVAGSRGRGDVGAGAAADASVTTVTPYARIRVGERVTLWGLLGHGAGDFSLVEDGVAAGTDISLSMGAIGFRSDLVSSARGLGLSLKSDAFLAQVDADPVPGLAEVSEDVNRVRLALEAAYDRSLAGGGRLTPSFEIGVRQDGGGVERGHGVEAGAGLRYSNPERGLAVELMGRSLLTHQAAGFEEWGGSGSVRFDPGESDRGFSLGLRSSWGASLGGVQQFWSQSQMYDSVRGAGSVRGGRLEVEAGYGLRVLGLSLGVSRRERIGAEPEHAVVLRGSLRR